MRERVWSWSGVCGKGYQLSFGETLFTTPYAFRCHLHTNRFFKSRRDSHHLFPTTSLNLPTFPFVVRVRSPQEAQSSDGFRAFVLIQQKPRGFRHEEHEQQHQAGRKRTQHCQPAPLQSYSWVTRRKGRGRDHQLVQTDSHPLSILQCRSFVPCTSSFS